MGCVLFSPIGNTDPIRGDHDGAWLHICRVYRPRASLIYLSADMCRKEAYKEPDGRPKDLYARTLALLNRRLYGDDAERYIKLICERDPECEEAHSLEYFVPRFQRLLFRLRDDYPDDEILINMSSGTAGMKGTLMALSALLPFRVRPIQVSDWKRGKGEKAGIVDADYPVEEAWICNEDNVEDESEFVNRASDQPMIHLVLAMRVNELCRLVREGDYHTALQEAQSESLRIHISPKAFSALRGAEQRSCLKTDKAVKSLQTSGFHLDRQYGLIPGNRLWQCAEYLLTMDNDLKSGAFDNFMRKLTPLLTNLCELYLLKLGKNVRQNGVNAEGRWERNRMPDEWKRILDNAVYPSFFKDGTYLAASNMLPLIRNYGDARAAGLAGPLRDAEYNVRNIVAHEIVPFGRDEIEGALQAKNRSGIRTPEELAARLREFLEFIQPFGDAYWHSYDAMNDHICTLLKTEA